MKILLIKIVLLFNVSSFATSFWPKCPQLTSEPLYIYGTDSLTIFLSGWNENTVFEFKAYGVSGLLVSERREGNKVVFALGDPFLAKMKQVQFKQMCDEVGSRSTDHVTPEVANRKEGGYIKQFGSCTYVKSLLDNEGFVLMEWNGGKRSPAYLYESELRNAKFDAGFYANINTIYIADKNKPNVLFTLEENILALQGFDQFLDAKSVAEISLKEKTNPSCDGKYGKLSFNVISNSKFPLYFSIDGGNKWFPEPTFEYLIPGTYTLLLRDNLESCLFGLPQKYTIEDTEQIVISDLITKDALDCQNTKGSISFKVNHPENKTFILNGNISSANPKFDNLNPGIYNVEVRFKSGNACSVKLENIEIENTYLLADKLITLKEPKSCTGKDGAINVKLNGDFEYSLDGKIWKTNGNFTNLGAGVYFLFVRSKDGKCATSTEVFLNAKIFAPGPAKTIDDFSNPVCAATSTGVISAPVDATKPALNYVWSRLEGNLVVETIYNTGSTLSNVPAGKYEVKIFREASCYDVFVGELIDPPAFEVNNPLNTEVALSCQGSEVLAEINSKPNATYTWYNEKVAFATGPRVFLNKAGDYFIKGVNEKGCIDTVQFQIKNTKEVFKPDFLLPSVGLVDDTIIGVDVTLVTPDSFSWIIPDEASLLVESFGQLTLMFSSLGTYPVTMEAYKAPCKSTIEKSILITDDPSLVEKDTNRSGNSIKKMVVYPNPNDGNFSIEYQLSGPIETRIIIYDQLGDIKFSTNVAPVTSHREQISLDNLPPGSYVVMVNTNSEVKIANVIVQ